MKEVTAIFDIGKTNKKFFLLDEDYKQIYKEYQSFNLTEDEDGYAADDLMSIEKWAKDLFERILETEKYNITSINFSTYGASLVHIDHDGKPLTPLYDYTKPYPPDLLEAFYAQYGGRDKLTLSTATPDLGMLNSGLQLYWIKKTKPEIYEKIWISLHLPQYMSFIFTGLPVSDYTSIGCHTMLWNYEEEDYHEWVYQEGLHKKLAPLVDTRLSVNMTYQDKKIKVGVGIHDSSAALYPYIHGSKNPFILISTGTWSITLNPFTDKALEAAELEKDCLNYMTVDGKQVKSSRLFLGQEYKSQIESLTEYFNQEAGYHRSVKFDEALYQAAADEERFYFRFEHIPHRPTEPKKTDLSSFKTFEEAYHYLMRELTLCQIESIHLVEGDSSGAKIYVDGGFVNNELYIETLSRMFSKRKILTSRSALGSSLGAALAISDKAIGKKFLKKKYGIKKHTPRILTDL